MKYSRYNAGQLLLSSSGVFRLRPRNDPSSFRLVSTLDPLLPNLPFFFSSSSSSFFFSSFYFCPLSSFFFLSTDSSLLSPFVPEAIEASSPYSSISVCTGTGIIVGLCFIYGWKRGKTKETKKKDGGKRVDRRDD